MTDFYMKCNTGLEWINQLFFEQSIQLLFTCSESAIETLEKGVKNVQS